MKTRIGEKIAELRKRKGMTQDEVAEQANINLRTVQRIENGETEPRGHTLSSICKVLDINIEDILDYGKIEDKSFYIYFHLSVLAGCIIPLGDIIVPLVLWLTKKDKIVGLNIQGKNLIIFRAFVDLIVFLSMAIASIIIFKTQSEDMEITRSLITFLISITMIYMVITVLYPVFIAISINKNKKLKSYYPRILKR